MESKALLSTSICLSRVPHHPQKPSVLALRGVIRQYETLMPLFRKKNSYLPQNHFGSSVFSVGVIDSERTSCVPGSRNFGPFLWSDSVLHILVEVGNRACRMLMVRSAVQRISFTFVGNKSSICMNKCSK